MFASPALAASGAAAPSGMASWVWIVPYLFIFLIMYLLIMRPQMRRQKQHSAMIGAVKKNDTVVTGGGLIGKVTKVEETEVEIEIAPNVRVKALKATLSDVRPYGTKPAND